MEHSAVLEQEIAELSRAIEEKRSALAAERGVITEREVVHQVVSNYVKPQLSEPSAPAEISTEAKAQSYLEVLDATSVAKVNELVAGIGQNGFKQTIAKAKAEIPYILDAFHDALVTYLYDELKARGVVK